MNPLQKLLEHSAECFPEPPNLSIGFVDDGVYVCAPVPLDLADAPFVFNVLKLSQFGSARLLRCGLFLDDEILFSAPISPKCMVFILGKLALPIAADPEISMSLAAKALSLGD